LSSSTRKTGDSSVKSQDDDEVDISSTTSGKGWDGQNLAVVTPQSSERQTGEIQIVTGSILDAKEDAIAHQGNCFKGAVGGLAAQVNKRFPHADITKQGGSDDYRKPGFFNLVGDTELDDELRNKPNSNRAVIIMFGQNHPGGIELLEDGTKMDAQSSKLNRQMWFQQSLNRVEQLVINSIAFPWQIGCGIAGGDWSIYMNMLAKFASKNTDIRVVIYKLPDSDVKAASAVTRQTKQSTLTKASTTETHDAEKLVWAQNSKKLEQELHNRNRQENNSKNFTDHARQMNSASQCSEFTELEGLSDAGYDSDMSAFEAGLNAQLHLDNDEEQLFPTPGTNLSAQSMSLVQISSLETSCLLFGVDLSLSLYGNRLRLVN
jgi:O-acetyl-ADP-ribose deacetylase (regulator of RNase III)